MPILLNIAERALNRPLLITRDKAAVIMTVLSGRIGIDATGMVPDASRFEGDDTLRDESGRPITGTCGEKKRMTYRRTESGIAIVSIVGSLVNRGAWIGASSGLVSYEGIQKQLKDVAADPKVTSVILDINSPGGEAVGAFETAAAVAKLNKTKPVTAFINGMAASAAYAIASAASEIVTIETGVAGSIGVVLLHADYSVNLANEGIRPTLIFAGEHKVDANPFEPLSASVKEDLQAEVNSFYEAFLKTVAKGRGARLTVESARATGARTFIGDAAVKAGLADRVGTFDAVLIELSSRASKGRPTSQTSKGASMSETNGAPAAEKAGITNEAHAAAVSAAEAKGIETGKKLGADAATARIKAILDLEAATGREAQARALAFETDMPPEAAAKVLEAGPKASAGAAFEARQAANPANTVGAGSQSATPSASDRKPATLDPSAIYSRRRDAMRQ